MECNKEEAIRAKGIAEKKMQCRDFVGARKIVLKAHQLFPDLDNVSQMLTVCEVHCSAETKVNGLEDWYGILQVEPTADESSIKKQYRKLALLLHPDKNKFAGAEAAFKLVVEAQRTLGDQAKRSLYDVKRRATVRTVATKPPFQQPNRTSYVRQQPAVPNSYTNHAAPQFTGLNQTQATQQQQTQAAYEGAQTFWTLCPCCGIRYQYYRTILNRTLRCQNCLKPFIACDLNAQSVPPGANSGYSSNQSGIPQHKEFQDRGAHNAGRQSNYGNGSSSMGYQGTVGGRPTTSEPFMKTGINTEVGGGSRNKAKENSEVDKDARKKNEVKFEKVKLEEVRKRERPSQKRGRKMVVESSDSDSSDCEEVVIEEYDHAAGQNGETTGSRYPRRSTRQKQNVTYNEDKSEDDEFETPYKSRRLRKGGFSHDADQSDKASSEGVRVPMGSTTVPKDEVKDGRKGNISPKENMRNGNEHLEKCKNDLREPELADRREGFFKGGANSKADSSVTQANLVTFSYPDPEFCDFEKDREANRFAVDQIWAVYDNLDGMPRFYARIRSVSSFGFRIRITWLELDPVGQSEMDWSDRELPVACGNFRHGGTEYTEGLPMFSHLMAWKGSRRNFYEIYPRKGEVWALFKDWDVKWRSDPDNHGQYKYEIVEVLSDFVVGTGVDVVFLVKVKGFVSVFCREVNKGVGSHQIPYNEMLRFSHMIPSYRMTGQEREGIPEGSYELDSASLPVNFEETFRSVSLDDVRVNVEDTVDKNNVPCSKSGTEEKKSTNEFENPKASKKNGHQMNGNFGENQSLKSGGLSFEGLNGPPERKHNQGSGSQYTATEAGKNVDGETLSAKCQVDKKEKHLDTPSISNTHTMENSNRSLPASPSSMVFVYPDSEFHNFESEKSNGKFRVGQIWALYCDLDGFPKYYALIRKVDLEDFKVHMTWLEACPLLKEEINWLDKDLPFGCGRFKFFSGGDAKQILRTVDMFSHRVQVERVEKKQQYAIYPHVGEVWALYKNWRPDWELTDLENCEYVAVEVIASSSSEMKVMILEKVDGFKAVFMPLRNTGNVTMMEIPQNEFLRFSHQIPSFRLTEERGGKLRGYWELDPASVPDVLLCSSTN